MNKKYTKQKISERSDELRSHIKNREIVEGISRAAPIGIGIVIDREFIFVNNFLCNMLEYSEEEIIGKNSRIIYPTAEDYEFVGKEKYRQMEKYGIGRVETRFKTKSGRILNIILSSTKVNRNDSTKGIIFTALDITDRKKIEEEVIGSRELIKRLMNNLPGIVYRCKNDKNWTMEFISQGCFKLTGYESEEILSNAKISYGNIILPEDFEQGWQSVQEAIDNKTPFNITYRIRTKDDQIKWVWEQGIGVYNSEGEIDYLEGFITDVTDKLESENKLKYRLNLEEAISNISRRFTKYQDLDDVINLSLSQIGKITNSDRTYIFLLEDNETHISNTHEWCNKGVSSQIGNLQNLPIAMFPWEKDKLEKEGLIVVEDISDLPSEASYEKEIIENQNIKSFLLVVLESKSKPIGFVGFDNVFQSKRWLEEDVNILKMFSEILGTAFEKQTYIEELKISEEKYRTLINDFQEGIWIIDENEYTTFVNPKMSEILGYSSEEMVGKHLFDFMNEDSILIAKNNLEKGRIGIRESYTFEFINKDGNTVYTSIATSPIIDKEGKYVGAMAGVQDITKRKKHEETIEQLNDNLRIINKILRHDIANALTVLTISLEMIETKNEDMKNMAFSSIKKCVDLIQNIRALESEMLIYYEIKPFSIKKIIELVKKNYSNIAIHVQEDCKVLADEALISAINNIIDNAIIHGKTDKVDIVINSDKNICEISIIDYGKGIPEDLKSRIFEEGVSFGESAQTGLGLYIVKKTIERYGGTIEVKDTDLKGATFVLKLKKSE